MVANHERRAGRALVPEGTGCGPGSSWAVWVEQGAAMPASVSPSVAWAYLPHGAWRAVRETAFANGEGPCEE